MMLRVFPTCLISAMILSVAVSQDKSTYYTVRHPDEFTIDWKAFYDKADEMTVSVRKELQHHLDLPYGSHSKQKLDIYLPRNKSNSAPVLVFLHGGGFREGDRAHYGYVAKHFAARGIITVVASYRLTPEFTYPAQPNDAKQLLKWTFHNISSFGGDPRRVFISGHSAGAVLTAYVGANRGWLEEMSLPPDLIKGFVPISGSYDLRSESRASYIPDPSKRTEASPMLNISANPPPCIVAVGSVEIQLEPSKDFAERLREKGGEAQLLVVEGMDHDDIIWALRDEKSRVTEAILRLMEIEIRDSPHIFVSRLRLRDNSSLAHFCPRSMLTPKEFRSHFPIFDSRIHLNSCFKGALSEEVQQAYEALWSSKRLSQRMWESLMLGLSTRRYKEVLPKMADKVGVSKSEVS